MLKRFTILLLLMLAFAAREQVAAQGKVHLTIESWRNDDLKIWHCRGPYRLQAFR
jgi:hypothetical protein